MLAPKTLHKFALQCTLPIGIWCLAITSAPCAQDSEVYERQVKPLLKAKCFACHGALKQEGGLRLDTLASMQKGGDSGPAIDVKQPEQSQLIARISTTDEATKMPKQGLPLTPQQAELLLNWIKSGAIGPQQEDPEEDPRRHWAFVTPVRPEVPSGVNDAWVKNPVDAFVAAKHKEHALIPTEEAPKHVLLRRVHLDLTGLPPTAKDLREFMADNSPDAYERVVDKLLDSPAYGERWGRNWMDVWRYSDWYGRRAVPDVMNSYPRIWRWRDWIVNSLNQDKGYDLMVQQMLAADELSPEDDENVVATGYIVRSWFKWNRNTWMRDLVEHTGKAFLGLTTNCAHCHDHKYDPITQEEYFKLRAIFEPLELRHDRVAGEPDPGPFKKYVYAESYGPIKSGMIRVFDEVLDPETFMYSKGDERNRMTDKPPISPGVPASLSAEVAYHLQPVKISPAGSYPGLKGFIQAEELQTATAGQQAATAAFNAAQAKWNANSPGLLDRERHALQGYLRQAQARRVGIKTPVPISGFQSLQLTAKENRSLLANTLLGLNELDDQGTLSFKLGILQDAKVNFQLATDVAGGLTGAFIEFAGGKITAFSPQGPARVDVGQYNLAAGQNRFLVTLKLDVPRNMCRLSVKSLSDGQMLVQDVDSTLNGWRPANDTQRGLFLDAHPGTIAMFDDLTFAKSNGTQVLRIDFEPDQVLAGEDLAGNSGWIASPLAGVSSKYDVVADSSNDNFMGEGLAAYRSARLERSAGEAEFQAAKAEQDAWNLELTSLQARIAADKLRYATGEPQADSATDAAANNPAVNNPTVHSPEVTAAIAAAVKLQKEAAVARSLAKVAAADKALAELRFKRLSDASQEAAITKAVAELATLQAAVIAARGELAKETTDYTPLSPQYPRESTGRRLAFARWITDRGNPLAARVAVNHIWGRHFGRPIVESTANLGRSGKRPSNQPLLDWLAVELMEHQWKMKHIHRLIVTSSTYRMKSQASAAQKGNLAGDPDNVFLWKFETSRMDAEVVRDAVLFVVGSLDPTMGGTEIEQSEGLTSQRRSIYISHHGEARMEFLAMFDAPDPCDCYRRTLSVMPQQALALANSELTLRESRLLAGRLWESCQSEAGSTAARDAAFVTIAFEQILSRPPTAQEHALSLEFLSSQAEHLKKLAQQAASAGTTVPTTQQVQGAAPDQTVPQPMPPVTPEVKSRENLVHALLNHNDFVTIR